MSVSQLNMNWNKVLIACLIRKNLVKHILHAFANTKFNKGNDTILTVSENNNLIVKAFATAWRYREMYEECGNSDKIIAMEHTSPRQFYRHLDLAYMNPETINHILSGKQKVNVNDLFQIARENQVTML